MDNGEKCFLLHINLGGKPSRTHIAQAAQQIKALVSEISPDHQLAYTSGDGSAFGFFLKSSLKAWQIAHRINSPGSDDPKPRLIAPGSPILHDDSLLVLEIGEDVSGFGKTKVQAWFRFHRPSPIREAKPQSASDEPKAQTQLASQLAKTKDKLGK